MGGRVMRRRVIGRPVGRLASAHQRRATRRATRRTASTRRVVRRPGTIFSHQRRATRRTTGRTRRTGRAGGAGTRRRRVVRGRVVRRMMRGRVIGGRVMRRRLVRSLARKICSHQSEKQHERESHVCFVRTRNTTPQVKVENIDSERHCMRFQTRCCYNAHDRVLFMLHAACGVRIDARWKLAKPT
jgi:hypothetical protein